MARDSQHHRYALAGLAAMLCCGAMLYRFPPDRYGVYPRCPFYTMTGLLCPGCGGTRAVAALLHGQFAEAWGWNAPIVMLLPVAVSYVALAWWRGRWPRVPRAGIAVAVAVAMVFGVVRNV